MQERVVMLLGRRGVESAMRILIAVVLFCLPLQAREIMVNRPVNAGDLQSDLLAAGFHVVGIQGGPRGALITLEDRDTGDPTPIIDAYVYVSPDQRRANREALEANLRAQIMAMPQLLDGTATIAEMRFAIRVLLQLLVIREIRN